MRRRAPALLLSVGWLLASAAPGRPEGSEELLLPGTPRERPIAAEEKHVYRVEVGEEPVLILVEQRGIDLVVEARGETGRETLRVSSPNQRWGPEVLLLPAGASEYRLEVGPAQKSVAPGRYTIERESFSIGREENPQRTAAFQAMSRAGQLAPGSPEARSEALAAYREALTAWRKLGERRWEAEALLDIAALEQQAGDLRGAITDYRSSLALWRELSDSHRVAAVLDLLGVALRGSGEIEAARGVAGEALTLWRSLGEKSEEEGTRRDLCMLDLANGAFPAALACFEEMLASSREQGNRRGEAKALNSLGGFYDLTGNPDAALDHYSKALLLWRALGDRAEEARSLNNLAVVHRALGEWQEALRIYGQVREILVSTGDRAQEAVLLNNVGFTYNSFGEPQKALAFLADALKLRRETGDRRGEIITLNNLGDTWRELGDLKKALEHHRQALERATALGDRRQEALSRLGLCEVRLDLGDPQGVLRELDPANLRFAEAGLGLRGVQALRLRGLALRLAGRPREALPVLQEALERRRALRDRPGEAEALDDLALVERALGLLDEARGHAEQAVVRVEELRTGFVSPDLRAAFLATRRRAYELRIDLLMDRHAADPRAGYDREAFEISEQARARSLLDALREGTRSPGGGVPAALLERRQSLRRRLSAEAAQQATRSGGAKAEALEREMEMLLSELDGVEAEIRRHDPRYAALSKPPAMTTGEIARLLDPGTVLLEYSLGEERSFLWAVSAEGLHSFILPPRKEIEGLARRAYEAMSTVEAGAAPSEKATGALGKILLGPVWSEAARFQRFLVVPDGALHVLPFAALPVPAPGSRQLLLDDQEVVYLPSATTLALQRQRLEGRLPAPKWAAVLADPVFAPDDPRLAGPAKPVRRAARGGALLRGEAAAGLLPRFERLPASRLEADTIAGLAPAGQVWRALDLSASRETVLSGELRAYRIVHFSTHGIADTLHPELSGLVLSLVDASGKPRDGFLGLSDIYELDLAADLVVLSGCRTALGKEVRGEGLMGLTRGFLYAGVPRVLGSQWPIQDRAAKELMARFYAAMWQDGLSPAAALRKAQLSLRRERRYGNPYFWAGFLLQGDWR